MEYVPGEQFSVPWRSEVGFVPAGAVEHVAAPAELENWPSSLQSEQEGAPNAAYFPAVHWVQPVAPIALLGTLPGLHGEQLEAPSFKLNFPDSQSTHSLTPPTEYLPCTQSLHSWTEVSAYFPIPQ